MQAITYADNENCLALFSTGTLSPGTVTNTNIQINNDGDNDIAWIKVTRPNPNFVVRGGNSQDFTTNYSDDSATFTDTTIGGGGTAYNKLFIVIEAGDEAPAASWTVEASSDPNGANPTKCNNSGLDITITDGSGPLTSDITASDMTANSANISWTTDQRANSQVLYGPSIHYSSATDISTVLSTSHSLSLTGLAANTVYHFKVISDDAAGNTTLSEDGTFMTTSSETKSTTISTEQPILATRVAIKAVPSERIPPTISLTTSFQKPFTVVPVISGTASDNVGLADILYSTDSGRNWLPAENVKGLGGTAATFSFQPLNTEDGNYSIKVRAIDTSGNTADTPIALLVIDRLPPLVGGAVLSNGPQVVSPDRDGMTSTIAGVDQKITLSAVGGPTSIIITTQAATKKSKKIQPGTLSFNLTKSSETGLWSGAISLPEPGQYQLLSSAIDGAGNKTSQALQTLHVVAPARTVSQTTKKPIATTVIVHFFEPQSGNWVVWDGSGYDQKNPQKSDKSGTFILNLPAGKYYLQAQASGYETLVTKIFETTGSTPLVRELALKPAKGFGIGSRLISWPKTTISPVNPAGDQSAKKAIGSLGSIASNLIGKPAPDFSLVSTDGTTIHTAELLGRPTLLTLGATWQPSSSQQFAIFDKLQSRNDINITPVAVQENAPKLRSYNAIGDYHLRWLVDPDSSLSRDYGISSLPTHYFIDRRGIVKIVTTGILSQQEIIDSLSSL